MRLVAVNQTARGVAPSRFASNPKIPAHDGQGRSHARECLHGAHPSLERLAESLSKRFFSGDFAHVILDEVAQFFNAPACHMIFADESGTRRSILIAQDLSLTGLPDGCSHKSGSANDDARSCLSAELPIAPGRSHVFSIHRCVSNGVFSAEEERRFRHLVPTLIGIFKRHAATAERMRFADLAAQALDAFEVPMFLVDRDRRVLFRNACAGAFLGGDQTALQLRNDILSIESGPSKSAFADLIAKACDSEAGSMPARDKSGARLYAVHAFSCVRHDVFPASNPADDAIELSEASALVVVTDPNGRNKPPHAVLTDVFNFTPAETRVAARLLMGATKKSIAEELGISEQTVRWHAKRLLRKTDSAREAEMLIRLARWLPPFAAIS